MTDFLRIHDQLGELSKDVAYIKGHLDAIAKVTPDHEQRIRKLEKYAYGIPASLIVSGLLFITGS